MAADFNTKCPICGIDGVLVKRLASGFIRDSLTAYYQERFPDDLRVSDYEILRCERCSLEYASPRKAGDADFYSWISVREGYYPGNRWEWPVVIEEVGKWDLPNLSVLEVGCGSGSFLRLLGKALPDVKAIGLDPTEGAIRECRKSGLEAYSETLDQYRANSQHERKEFDFICAFHCLEHVTEPKELLSSMIRLTHSKSRIFLSTPYSPMSFETGWYDPLNHPPHHVTRWKVSAYEALTSAVGWHVDLIMPEAGGLLSRALSAIDLAARGPNSGAHHRLLTALAHPYKAAREIARQANREKIKGHAAADVVLTRFQNAAATAT